MNYIYDVLLNFNKNLYEFYDWNLNDSILHVRKIPLIKISTASLFEIKNNKVKISDELNNQIKNRTEVFSKNINSNYNHTCLFCDGINVIGVAFNTSGVSMLKSKMLIDEEMEVLEVCERIQEKEIDYKITQNEVDQPFKTRLEKEIDFYITDEINKINDIDKLRYLYYECFNETEQEKDKILLRINSELQSNWDKIAPVLYDFFKLTSIKK